VSTTGVGERVARRTFAPWFVAALPGLVVLAVTFLQLSRGWSPLSDDAVIALRAWDVLSRATPLLGQATLASGPKGQTMYDLGPLYYFLLSLPEHASPTMGPLLGSAVIWLAAAYTLVVAARSAYGPTGLFVASVSLLLLEWQAPAVISDPLWNPHAAVIWFLSALAALLTVIEGMHRWYPFATFAASFAIQANVVFLAPLLVLWVLGTASLLSSLSSARSKETAAARRLVVGIVVGFLCWIPTLVQEVRGRPGNISSWVWYLSHHASVGFGFGLRSIAAMVDPRVMFATLRSHSIVVTVTFIARESPVVGILALCLLALVAAWSCYRRRTEYRVLGVAVLVTLSIAYTFANLQPSTLTSVDYLSVALIALASVLWVLLILAGVSVVPDLAFRKGDSDWRPVPYVFLVAAVALLFPRVVDVADIGTSSSSRSATIEASTYVEEHVPQGPVVVAVTVAGPQSIEGYTEYADLAGVVWDLRVAGWQPEVYGALWRVFGTSYAAHRGAYLAIAHAGDGGDLMRRMTIEHPSP
jgi:hypothetical protein